MNKGLSAVVREAAKANGINGIMALTDISPISYERTRKVWDGVTSAKLSDYASVMGVLGYDLRFIQRSKL